MHRDTDQDHRDRRQDRHLPHRAQPAADEVRPASGPEAAEGADDGDGGQEHGRRRCRPSAARTPGTRRRTWRSANCGTTSSELAACTRQSVGRRYGDAAAPATGCPADPPLAADRARAADRGAGSRANTAISSATTRQASAGTASAAPMPWVCASGGITSAAAATPSGCPIWRTPMATPRCRTPNQPITRRPLAALTEAPAAPIRANARPRAVGWDAVVLARAIVPVSVSPVASTARSPYRSARAPQRIRVSTSPTDGAAASAPASASDSPSVRRSVGRRKGRPNMSVDATVWAAVPRPSISQRRESSTPRC